MKIVVALDSFKGSISSEKAPLSSGERQLFVTADLINAKNISFVPYAMPVSPSICNSLL